MLVLSDIKEIKATMGTIHKIEETTASFSKELSGIASRTAELEEVFEATSARVRELGDDVSTLKTVARKQENSISALKRMKEDIHNSTNQKVGEMKALIGTQTEEAELFQSTINKKVGELEGLIGAQGDQAEKFQTAVINLKQDISVEVDEKINKKFDQLAQEAHFQSLREQAFDKRFNLVVTGLSEDDQKLTAEVVSHFLDSTLGIKNMEFASALRMGPTPADRSSYIRPIIVKFSNIKHRNRVWKKRRVPTGENDDQKIRVQADLPRELKEGVWMLYNVVRAASKFEQFNSAKVFNYQLELNGKIYQPSQLEELPEELRPSALASPRSEYCLAFFSKRSVLSNHYPSEFKIDDQVYHTMEQYLAVKRAIFSDNSEMIRKANTARDPRQAKYVLNVLKEDRPDEWYEGIEEVLLEGLRAKFMQNPVLGSFLIDTNNLLLGEASKDTRWGIGMTLDDPEVLNSSLWNPEGNLLGQALMKVRGEIPWNTA